MIIIIVRQKLSAHPVQCSLILYSYRQSMF